MAHALALGTQTCQEAMFLAWGCPTGMSGIRADPRGFTGATGHSYTRLPDRDVSLLGGVSVTSWPRVNRILIPTSCTVFFLARNLSQKNSEVKRPRSSSQIRMSEDKVCKKTCINYVSEVLRL